MSAVLTLTGLSGRSSSYQTCAFDAVWRDIPGCYAFVAMQARMSGPDAGLPRVLYIGETASFRLQMQEDRETVWASALRFGATHVLARVIASEPARRAEERDLIRQYQPPLNIQHVGCPPPPMGWSAGRGALLRV